ncbi:Uracil-DNA glycosylase [Halorubrum xinjiangense]|uniref:Uracil-DNA glycosylase n=1 Tax=Halorubrum xinjiangense TaxID=261291 RepID=A0A1G7Q7T3_9EURY|nr:uracil-DNA glycosylase family protein [Halorubrum xinjiangense]SDF94518.1 Uracil-DNA glycosylase [Halorubrum xinjiangense]
MSEDLHSYLQQIESNWHQSQQPCKTCPHWATGGFSRPFFAASREGNLDADVVFIGKEPGTNTDKPPTEWHREGISLTEAKKRMATRDWSPSEFPRDNSAMFSDHLLEIAVGKKAPLKEPSDSPSYKYYLTNAKKCHETYDDLDEPFLPDEGDYSEAADHCTEYLSEELKLIKPKIVVTLGSPATKAVFSRFDSLPPKSNAPKLEEGFFDKFETPDWTLIPAIHPTNTNVRFNQFQKSALIEPILNSYAEQGKIKDLGDFNGSAAREAYFNLLRQRIENLL